MRFEELSGAQIAKVTLALMISDINTCHGLNFSLAVHLFLHELLSRVLECVVPRRLRLHLLRLHLLNLGFSFLGESAGGLALGGCEILRIQSDEG